MDGTSIQTMERRKSLLKGLKNTCRLFWGPDPETCREVMHDGYFSFIVDLAVLNRGLEMIRHDLEAFLNSYPDGNSLCQALEEQYVYLFISRKGGVKSPLYHSCYMSEKASLMGPPARIMLEKLRSAGLNLAGEIGEPPDHIAIEGEYLYFLLEKGWSENRAALLEEARGFAENIMLPWVPILRKRLEEEPEGRFYCLSAGIFCALLKIISEMS